jgi:hypothetical protein
MGMVESTWEKQAKLFLKRASDELKRTGGDLRGEAQKIWDEVRNPNNQQKVRDNLQDLGTWARKAVGQAAELVDGAVQRLDADLRKLASKKGGTKRRKASTASKKSAARRTKRAPRKAE